MTNKEIANAFADLGAIMELHGENPFKIRSYSNAYLVLRKFETPLSDLPRPELEAIKGVGKNIADKIQELLQTGSLQTYQNYADKTPSGVVEMLRIKGLGIKKILAIWKDLEIETVGELLYACNENRLIELHGFGKKTQEEIRKNVELYLKTRGQIFWADADDFAKEIETAWHFDAPFERVGELRRNLPLVGKIEFLTTLPQENTLDFLSKNGFSSVQKSENWTEATREEQEIALKIYHCESENWGSKLFRYSSSADFLADFLENTGGGDFRGIEAEKTIFEKANLPFITPELRDFPKILNRLGDEKFQQRIENLIQASDIRGVVHAHTTYSDGINSLEEMAAASHAKGFSYLAISDHSKAAFYANGLKEDRLQAQWAEIDALNLKYASKNFRILKGIESDILNDGSLDYGEDILKNFDFIIASVHSNLKMDEAKATARVIKAVENPYTTILGHPTGRLLRARTGYPLDFEKVMDACAANGVSIELNANPYRLDLDWTLIDAALNRGILISINPDAHSREGIDDIKYGINVARKGGLNPQNCLNARDLEGFLAFASKK
ncbi:MAG: hypothetical protein RL757_1327 [Bacteroidota bacterium]|jgi:DNA polymerase (family 10)